MSHDKYIEQRDNIVDQWFAEDGYKSFEALEKGKELGRQAIDELVAEQERIAFNKGIVWTVEHYVNTGRLIPDEKI